MSVGARSVTAVVTGLAVEDGALDGGALEHGQLVAGQTVEPRREQQLHRRRHGNVGQVARGDPAAVLLLQQPVVDQHRDELFEEERVPFGGGGEALGRARLERSAAEQVLEQHGAVGGAQRVE